MPLPSVYEGGERGVRRQRREQIGGSLTAKRKIRGFAPERRIFTAIVPKIEFLQNGGQE